ncbi:ankyrin, partial [Wilcoxina mikolae CBS 423.85]
LWYASNNGHSELVRLLLKNGAEANAHITVYDHVEHAWQDIGTCLAAASDNGFEEVVTLLLENGAKCNYFPKSIMTPFEKACANGHVGCKLLLINILIECGADINSGQTNRDFPLECAAKKGDSEVFELLLEKGSQIRTVADRLTTIQAASFGGNTKIIQLVINSGVDIDINEPFDGSERYCGSPLQLAAAKCHDAAVRLLYDNGADIDS